MKIRNYSLIFIFPLFLFLNCAGKNRPIPVPSAAQLRWHNYERIMFIHFNPNTWTGREYDDLSLPLSRMNPSMLDTDQWCETARSWGAKMIIMVAKHSGGFCWWQTNTCEYGVRNIPWRNGKGDVLADLALSCRKYGLDLGVYIYPGDETWGAGTGGRTKDPAKQEAYNKVFRQQLVEVFTRYGPIREVWFDGSCVIDVRDILEKYARDAVIFQGPMATIRWVGNEDGIAPDPNWYTLKRADLASGVATAQQSDPDGDVYAPVEMDLPLLGNGGHKWFWARDCDSLLLSVDQLMEVYCRSAGRGGVMLLNSTPDTMGLIPESHVRVYKAFGVELDRRFGRSIQSKPGNGRDLEMSLAAPTPIDHVVLQEDLTGGQRVREYRVEGLSNGDWQILCQGSSIGSKKIDAFTTRTVEKVRLRIRRDVAPPIIKNFSVYGAVE